MSLTITDLEQLQTKHPEWQMVLQNGDTLVLPELLPGWELAVSELWPPEFE